jgi:hypothetical protein
MDNLPIRVWLEEISLAEYAHLFEQREIIFDVDALRRTWFNPRTRLTKEKLELLGITNEAHAAAIHAHMKKSFGDDIAELLATMKLAHIAGLLKEGGLATVEDLMRTFDPPKRNLSAKRLRLIGINYDCDLELFMREYDDMRGAPARKRVGCGCVLL